MARSKHTIALIAMLACAGTTVAQDYFDDVYYNPKKETTVKTTVKKESNQNYVTVSKPTSTYIANMADMDVDAYNRRGEQYYVSEIDTIGTRVENGEDFVYTQQIQKYYNPTIVVENANNLNDVLANAYGNVDIVINNNGYPVFAPYNGWNWPYYNSYWSPLSWNFSFGGWGWSVGWYDPWISWNWGPVWGPAWRPGPSWSWGPSWRPGPNWGWGPPPPPRGPLATWSPNGNRPMGGNRPGALRPAPGAGMVPNRGSVASGRPVGGIHRPNGTPTTNSRPMGNQLTSRPTGVVKKDGKWQYNTSTNTTPSNTQPGVSTNTGRNKPGTGSVSRPNNGGNNKTTNNVGNNRNNSYNNRNTGNNNRSNSTFRNTPSRSTGGGSFGGGRNTGGGSRGGGGGRHR